MNNRLPKQIKDIRNQKFGMLSPIEYVGKGKWLCKCDCGNSKVVAGCELKRKNRSGTKSCGCMKKVSLDDFISRCINNHEELYDYSEVSFSNLNDKIKIYCKYCKKYFYQTVHHHLQGKGCPSCKWDRLKDNRQKTGWISPSVKDRRGERHGRLLYEEYLGDSWWLCSCDCGNKTKVQTSNIEKIKSCGCLGRETTSIRSKVHGMSGTTEYNTWLGIKQRCYDEKSTSYKDYGARGITVCDRWLDSFENFYEDMGNKPSPELSIERVDNDKGYSPDNCVWATYIEQSKNRRSNRLLTFNGETHSISEWGIITEIGQDAIRARIDKLGWTIEKSLTTPKRIFNGWIRGNSCA